MRCRVRVAALLVAALLLAPGVARAQELTVAAAVGMKEAVETIGRAFVEDRSGVRLRYRFGATADLVRQVHDRAPIDVLIAGGTQALTGLGKADLIAPGTRRSIASDVLVALKPVDSVLDVPGPSDLLDRRVRRIAMPDARSAPGQYAEESLRALRLWERLRPKMTMVASGREALDLVVRGEVDVAVLFATDAVTRLGRIRLAFAFPEDTHAPIVYQAAVVKATRAPAAARAFVEFLTSAEARAVLARLGFEEAPAAP